MATKTNYTPYTLLHKKFPANVKGYDPEKVDETLDEIILDYKAFEKYYERYGWDGVYDELKKKIENYDK